jgi:hypothetical protein
MAQVEIALPYIEEIDAAGFNVETDNDLYWIALAGYVYCKTYEEIRANGGVVVIEATGHVAEVSDAIAALTTEANTLISEIYDLYD